MTDYNDHSNNSDSYFQSHNGWLGPVKQSTISIAVLHAKQVERRQSS